MEPAEAPRPWPVVLLTALGAWLAAVPLLAVIGMLLGGVLSSGIGPYLAGVLLVAGAVVVLRAQGVPVFFEQLAFPALLAGLGALYMGLHRDLPRQPAATLLCLLVLVIAWLLPRTWLRVLLGAGAAALAVTGMLPHGPFSGSPVAMWLGLHVALGVWVAATLLGPRNRFIAPVGAGWVVLLLAGFSVWSGMTFMLAGLAPGIRAGAGRDWLGSGSGGWRTLQFLSASLGVAAAAMAGRRWHGLRNPAGIATAAVAAALAGLMPALGAVVLVMAVTGARRQWRIAAAAALAALWILGSFYYRLQWPLGTKALVLVFAGAVLGIAAWWMQRAQRPVVAAAPRSWMPAARIGLSAAATLAFANYAIVEKEELIANGRKVFVELAPVDPRSLVQGDYMRLNYRLPDSVEDGAIIKGVGRRPLVVLKTDERGIARPLRVVWRREDVQPPEMVIELTPKDGRWTLVSDAWFFREGDDRHWQAAKYGEFRVMPDGRALLVGLADAQLRSLASSAD